MGTVTLQKSLGAYYTGADAAAALVAWAVRDPKDAVLDPSCGDGVFLAAASARLIHLGAVRPNVAGVDLNPEAAMASSQRVPTARVISNDFFAVDPSGHGLFDAVVGNPPFIRYQSFSGSSRKKALGASHRNGVTLSELSSAWAPFVVHACAFLKPGGRLAMVLPSELGHAAYAREVLSFLLKSFGNVHIALFRKKLFGDLSQGTVLCFCSGYGELATALSLSVHDSIESFDINANVERVSTSNLARGDFRFQRFLISGRVRQLYDSLSAEPPVRALGDVASVGIGYVTGANEFFHLSQSEVEAAGIRRKNLRPAILTLSGFSGLRFTKLDWESIKRRGEKSYLLAISDEQALSPEARRYIAAGEAAKMNMRFKCKVRTPWYSVPHVRKPHIFLSYMSGTTPKLIQNQAGVVCPNTVHTVVLRDPRLAAGCIVGWQTGLSELSCEIEGHAMGGGLLKLEPTEARRVKVPIILRARPILNRLEAHTRTNRSDLVREFADYQVLIKGLGIKPMDCDRLRDAAKELRGWRLSKGE
jgi:adenine-specific DNA-methyltransferase